MRPTTAWRGLSPARTQEVPGDALSKEGAWRLAYHETGHALLGMLQPGADERRKVSIVASEQSSEAHRHEPESERRLPGENYRRGRIIGLLGGLAAEEIVYGNVTEATAADLDDVRALVTEMVQPHRAAESEEVVSLLPSLGLRSRVSGDRSRGADDDVDQVMEECLLRALEILRENRVRLDMLAHALMERETLDASEALAAAGISAGGNVSPRTASSRLDSAEPRLRRQDGSRVRRRTTRAAHMSQLTEVAPTADVAAITEPGFRHVSVRALSRAQRARYWALALIWGVVTTTFWVWWLGHARHSTPVLYWLQTVMLFYQTTLLPSVYWSFVGKMRRPIEVEPPAGVGVALIALCVPAEESLSVIRKQLDAMHEVSYGHDSWILDEGGSADVRALAEERGVHYFTRRGIAFWNQPAPPFQAKTKAGNVNAWLDHVASLGLDYEVFVQFDVDHRPRRDYLDRTLGYFRDSSVAWVQAPSVAGNLENWTARGLTEQDLVFHGPLQMGFYGATGTPFIVGSHTSYRTSAIREIGGFQPTRAEDHLDTVVLAAHGYKGVFVPDLIAVGDGPETFATYLRQQFAWAYSMIQIFFHHTPRLVRRYSLRQAVQFLFCQSWYTLWSISLAFLWALPTVALLTGHPIAAVKLPTFLVYFVPVVLASSLMWCETRRWFQPGGVKLSWRGILLGVARWPVIVWALVNVALRIKRPYMITPKGVAGAVPRALTLYGPGLTMALLPLGAVWAFQVKGGATGMHGYYWLALANAMIGLLLVATTVALEICQICRDAGAWRALRLRGGVVLVVLALVALAGVSVLAVWAPMTKVIA